MEHTRVAKRTIKPGGPPVVPIGDLERIRAINRDLRWWLDEGDFVRDAVRRRIEEVKGWLLPVG
jgi:hypothetical protein